MMRVGPSRIIVAAALYFLIVFGVGFCSPSIVKNGTCMPKSARVLTAGTCAPILFLSLPLEVGIRFFAKWQQHF
jgi:hypothetical protein